MKILVLHSGGIAAKAEEAGNTASKLSLSFGLKNISHVSNAELLAGIKSASHIIVCVDRKNANASWVYLCAGFALGRGRPEYCCFYGEAPGCYRGKYPVCGSLKKLQNYLKEEKRSEDRNMEVLVARERIITAGYAYTEEGLVRSVKEGDGVTVSMFLLAGFSPDSTNTKGVPLLNLAIRKGAGEIGRLLVEKGADVNVPAPDNGNTPLMEAVARKDEEMVRTLIEKRCKLNVQNKSGQTALVLAAGAEYEEIVRLLVEAGADRDVIDALGMTAKKYAELFKNKKISTLLK